ncbi:MAG: hypothetical protein D4R64_01455 [Porphyromonadaceae bacterium]|nr:MAG: hypothetical protein D4R64_01455 [Porphyromonadaceae bacterium]
MISTVVLPIPVENDSKFIRINSGILNVFIEKPDYVFRRASSIPWVLFFKYINYHPAMNSQFIGIKVKPLKINILS